MENKQFIDTRTHQKREIYRVIGKSPETMNEKLDFQIYDDHEFYQGLIKDFLNNTSQTDLVDPNYNLGEDLALTQEYLKKRERMKKIRDKKQKSNKISKDRKIKYIIHDKLINFMAPRDEEMISTGRKDILNFTHFKRE